MIDEDRDSRISGDVAEATQPLGALRLVIYGREKVAAGADGVHERHDVRAPIGINGGEAPDAALGQEILDARLIHRLWGQNLLGL